MKRSPLNRKTELKAKKPLQRTEWKSKPKTSLAPRSHQIARVSKTSKRGREQAQRAEFVAKILIEAKGLCQVWYRIKDVDYQQARQCLRIATEVHEPLTRARGGSILDPMNAVAICRKCHMWCDDHPSEAESVGLLIKSNR